MSKRTKLASCIVLSLLGLLWFWAANHFNLFLRRSQHFSMETFRAIKPGTRIEDAIARLGEPVDVVRSKYDLGCPGCTAYYFQGNPPPWLVSYQEAWLLVDSRGEVVTVTVNTEP